MTYFDVVVVDRATREQVCVGSLLERYQAAEIKRVLQKYDNDVIVISYEYRNGKVVYK